MAATCNPDHKYTMWGIQLEESYSERDSVVEVDSDLNFRSQAAYAATKASQILPLIQRSFQVLDCVTLPLLFKTLWVLEEHIHNCSCGGELVEANVAGAKFINGI